MFSMSLAIDNLTDLVNQLLGGSRGGAGGVGGGRETGGRGGSSLEGSTVAGRANISSSHPTGQSVFPIG